MPATAKVAQPWKNKPAAKPALSVAPPPAGSNSAGMIDELAQVRADKSKLDKRDKELTAQLKDQLGDGEHRGGKALLVITTSDRETFDSKAFKAAHEDLAAKYTAPKPVTVVNIKALL